MALIERYRVLRPSSRNIQSPYKIGNLRVTSKDILRITIFDESDSSTPVGTYEVTGSQLINKKSIHFRAIKKTNGWNIQFYGVDAKRID